MKPILICLGVLLLAACSQRPLPVTPTPPATPSTADAPSRAAVLQKIMTGSFSSAEQAANDSDYYSISLHMYPIWEGKDGHYLYVEQALSSQQEKPYRQRIYKLVELPDGRLGSELFLIENDSLFIGKWKEPEFFDKFDESLLTQKEGCTVYLTQKGDTYSGATNAKDCTSTMRGATYATARVRIQPGRVSSWDQGWSEKDEQVWGATKAGYVFIQE